MGGNPCCESCWVLEHSQEEMGPLCEKVNDQMRVSKSDVIRPSDAWGVGQRWRGQFHESRWLFHFEAGHQLVARILGGKFSFSEDERAKSLSGVKLAWIQNTTKPQGEKKSSTTQETKAAVYIGTWFASRR